MPRASRLPSRHPCAKRLRAAYKGATAELDAATASYNGAVLDAVREASDQVTLNASLKA